MTESNKPEKLKLGGAEDAGRYFRHMADFVGFTERDAEAIRESRYIIEKHIPNIVAEFYAHLLRYPPTRKYFLKKDGAINQEYLQMRMHHLSNFWRRTASGYYDDNYAGFVDYVGRAHTTKGADPTLYIPERYVIGQVGFVQHAISKALEEELHEIDPDWERRALQAWNKLMMVILELLSRAYGHEREPEKYEQTHAIDHTEVLDLAVETYERSLGISRSIETKDVLVGRVDEIPEGERKLLEVADKSIGVFHHKGCWYAIENKCLHRGGPIATGTLDEDVITCPWHGYQYNLTNGELLMDRSAHLEMYPVEVRDGEIHIQVKQMFGESRPRAIDLDTPERMETETELPENAFRLVEIEPGGVSLVHLNGAPVAVYNVGGTYYATADECTHADGPLSEGELDESMVICPWHGSCFDVTNGEVLCGPADEPVKIYRVVVEGEIGTVMEIEEQE